MAWPLSNPVLCRQGLSFDNKMPEMWDTKDIAVQIVEERAEDEAIKAWLVIENRGATTLDRGWRLYFSLGLEPRASDTRVNRVLLDGRYGFIEPGDVWPGIAPGRSLSIEIESWLFKGMPLQARQGFHITLVDADSNEETLTGAPTILPPKLVVLNRLENTWISDLSPSSDVIPQTPLRIFEKNIRVRSGAKALTVAPAPAPVIIPAVRQYVTEGRTCSVSGFTLAASDPSTGVSTDVDYLRAMLAADDLLIEDGCPISVTLRPELASDEYRLVTKQGQISIEGGDGGAVYYAIHSFRQLMAKTDKGCDFTLATVEDSPGFEHRGLFLDIARHFQYAGQIRKTIEVMSAYKLNRLQLGISNDEGWRLEIPSIPELTEIGSRRAYQGQDDKDSPDNNGIRALYPAWGDNHELYGGFLTTEDFIDLLKFAARCHVEIIVEFNLPGHANAIIQSLRNSRRFLLLDPADQSVHRSAQGYTRNVVNVCLDSTYEFVEVVLTDIKKLYDRAGVVFKRIHFGGDEIPTGAWVGSKVCQTSPLWNPAWDMEQEADAKAATMTLTRAYCERITALAEKIAPGIQTGFWHEMSPHVDDSNGNRQCYFNVWTTEAGDRSIPRAILAGEQQLVISNASFLYLDQPYGLHPEEPGLPWAAYIDTELIYHFDPLTCWEIPEDKQPLVLGLQAQLWSETVFNASLMDYYLFPRLLAVAERCWNRSPADDWPAFARALGERELNYLESKGIEFRVPPPGVKVEGAILYANVVFPGLEIRHTSDGTDPEPDAVIYDSPVNIEEAGEVKLRTFTRGGRGSRVVSIKLKPRPSHG